MSDRKSSTADGAPLQRIESFQYPATHVGHLSEGQSQNLERFKTLCEQKGYYRPRSAGHPESHDDETLLRFLRARKFIPQDAFTQFKETEDWRKENKIDELYQTIDINEYDETRRLYPQWTGRRDKRGIPVYVFEVAHLNHKRMAAYEKSLQNAKSYGSVPPNMMRLFALYENLIKFTMPLCSSVPDRPYAETPISQSNNIVDITNVGLKQFWNLKQHMQDASQLATAHYPETLDRIFIIGAPSFFPTVWGWVKRWFDPITVSKIFILSDREMKSTLAQYIDPSNIPKKYGGTLDWEWGSLPNLDPAIANSLDWDHPSKDAKGRKAFPAGPVRWKKTSHGDMVAVAVGSEHGHKREEKVATMPVHDKHLNIGPVLSPQVSNTEYGSFGPASTTGTHTHPAPGQDYFAKSGNTPTEEEDEPLMEGRKMSLPSRDFTQNPTISVTHAEPSARYYGATAQSNTQPGARYSGSVSQSSTPPRQGTSSTRYEQQNFTHARGEMAEGTPAVVDHGYGDKTQTFEPSTVGQARKDVSVPEAKTEEPVDNSYLGQAKAAASNVYSTATSVLGTAQNTVTTSLGYGETAKPQEQETQHAQAPRSQPEDPRVDKMASTDVEDFIRSKYASHPEWSK